MNNNTSADATDDQVKPRPVDDGADGYSPVDEPEKAPNGADNTFGLTPEQVSVIHKRASGVEFKSLAQIAACEDDPDDDLIGNGWLRRGAIVNIIGPTGIGKSSAVIGEMCVRFACGQAAFGIPCPLPLKILILQAENDKPDMQEMVLASIRSLTDTELVWADKNTKCGTVDSLSGISFILALAQWLIQERPDILVLDPLNDYSGCDPSDAEKISAFYRLMLRPLLRKYRCGCLIIQHTPKMRGWATEKWKPIDYSYVAAGNADTANAARATLMIDPTYNPSIFRLIAGKRWQKIGWKTEPGQSPRIRYWKHAPQGVQWLEADEDDIESVEAEERRIKRESRGGRPGFDEKKLLKVLVKAPLNHAAFCRAAVDRFVISPSTFERALDRLSEAGKVVKKDEKWHLSEPSDG